MSTIARPLAGLTVLEAASSGPLALDLAIGFCGRVAADLGARVIRVSERNGGPSPGEAERLFLHAGKRQLTAAQSQYRSLVDDLSKSADALVCDISLVPELRRASAIATACIGMSIDAPLAGSEFTVEARAGLLDLVGEQARQPLRLAGHPLAYTAGTALYLAMMASVLEQKSGQKSGPKRVDLLDIGVWLNWKTLGLAMRRGRIPTRAGASSEWFVVPCADGYVALVYRVQEWESLKRATADPRLSDERFATIEQRRAHRGALNAVLSDIFIKMTRAEIRMLSLQFKLPLGPVWTPAELPIDAHMAARGFFQSVSIEGRDLLMPRLPVVWNGAAFGPVVERQSA